MAKCSCFALLAALLLNTGVQAQNPTLAEDPVLFTVAGEPVHVSEFTYIYTKTNGDKADFSRESLEEYLDLYIKFKLKVRKARDLRLDTIPSLREELAGYRKQLADSYLIDREVTDRLVEEAYQRRQQDVDISHIVVKFSDNAGPEDTLRAWTKIMQAKAALDNGMPFEEVARKYSDDPNATKNGGRIGYVTALFPNGLYNLETAAYTLPLGQVHGPIRTEQGYHLLLIHQRRPARGEIEVAHILARFDRSGGEQAAKARIDSAYQELQTGQPFEIVARNWSHDKITAPKGGYIGFFGINRYEKSFEDAAFALKKDGDYSEPFKSSIGWHIVKRISKRGDEPLPLVKARLTHLIKKDSRFEMARRAMIERIKRQSHFQEFETNYQNFVGNLGDDFLTYRWKAPNPPSSEPLFAFGELQFTVGDFADYLARSTRKRLTLARKSSLEEAVRSLYEDFVEECALKYEERQLEKKYPEFKALMREYEEGILLFEATKRAVWDKAAQDTAGLKAFFETVKDNYQWKERAVVSEYRLKDSAKRLHLQLREYAKTHSPEEVLAHFNTDSAKVVFHRKRTFERGRNELLDKIPQWEPGALSISDVNKRDKSIFFFKIEEVLPPQPKTLDEARGYVIADYQDVLEAAWVEELRKEYPVEVNRAVFESLIRAGQ